MEAISKCSYMDDPLPPRNGEFCPDVWLLPRLDAPGPPSAPDPSPPSPGAPFSSALGCAPCQSEGLMDTSSPSSVNSFMPPCASSHVAIATIMPLRSTTGEAAELFVACVNVHGTRDCISSTLLARRTAEESVAEDDGDITVHVKRRLMR